MAVKLKRDGRHGRPPSNRREGAVEASDRPNRADNGGTGSERVHGHTHSSHHRRRHSSRRWVPVLALVSGLLVLLVIVLSVQIRVLWNEKVFLSSMERQLAEEVSAQREQIAKLREEMALLVQGRTPRLHPIVLDQVVPVNQAYVRHVLFTVTRKGSQENYEYTLVMENDSLRQIDPDVKVMFFDRNGIQVGISEIGWEPRGKQSVEPLARGEIRNHSASVNLFDESPPEYFLIRVAG